MAVAADFPLKGDEPAGSFSSSGRALSNVTAPGPRYFDHRIVTGGRFPLHLGLPGRANRANATMAMAAGMLPTALTLSKGSEFRQPMAVAVIGGLITSTALSLILVPVVYEFVDDFEAWLTPIFRPLITPKDLPGEPALARATPQRPAAE